jgi:hypothetical protein
MRDLALQGAGGLATVVAVTHGAIAGLIACSPERTSSRRGRVICCGRFRKPARSTGSNRHLADRRAGGRLAGRPPVDHWGAVLVYGYAAVANAVTRGRHVGWLLIVAWLP